LNKLLDLKTDIKDITLDDSKRDRPLFGEYHETDPPFIIESDPGLIIEIDPPLIM
jgi:hypothetical protein